MNATLQRNVLISLNSVALWLGCGGQSQPTNPGAPFMSSPSSPTAADAVEHSGATPPTERLPKGARARLGSLGERPTVDSVFRTASMSADGGRVAYVSALKPNTVVVEAPSESQVITVLGLDEQPLEVVLSPSGESVMIRFLGRMVVHELPSGRPLFEAELDAGRAAFSFAPDGKTLAVSSADITTTGAGRGGKVTLYRVPSGEETVHDFEGVVGLAFSPDGLRIALGRSRGRQGELVVVDATGEVERKIDTGDRWFGRSLLWLDSSRVAVAHAGETKVVDLPAQSVGAVMLHDKHVSGALQLALAEGQLVTASCSSSLKVWEPETGALAQQVALGAAVSERLVWAGTPGCSHDEIRQLAIASDGTMMTVSAGRLELRPWTAREQRPHDDGHRTSVRSVDATPDGARIVSVSVDGVVRRWQRAEDAYTSEALLTEPHRVGRSAVLDPEGGERIVVAGVELTDDGPRGQVWVIDGDRMTSLSQAADVTRPLRALSGAGISGNLIWAHDGRTVVWAELPATTLSTHEFSRPVTASDASENGLRALTRASANGYAIHAMSRGGWTQTADIQAPTDGIGRGCTTLAGDQVGCAFGGEFLVCGGASEPCAARGRGHTPWALDIRSAVVDGRLFDLTTGEAVADLWPTIVPGVGAPQVASTKTREHVDPVTSAAFTERSVVTGHESGRLFVWDR